MDDLDPGIRVGVAPCFGDGFGEDGRGLGAGEPLEPYSRQHT